MLTDRIARNTASNPTASVVFAPLARSAQIIATQHPITPHLLPHRFGCRVAYGRYESNEPLTQPICLPARPEGIAQKVKLTVPVIFLSARLFAVHDLGLALMQFQLTFCSSSFQLLPKLARVRFALSVTDGIVGVTLERHIRMMLSHPLVKCIVQE